MAVPLYVLVVTYTAVQLFLHITKQFFGAKILLFSLVLFTCGQPGVL
jgi:hypothetical protein